LSPEENVAAVRDFVERAWNAGDESVFEEHLAPDFGGAGGRERFKDVILASAPPSRSFTSTCRDVRRRRPRRHALHDARRACPSRCTMQ